MKNEDIDLSDMPEVLDWSGAEIGKFYRPPKKAVTVRLDADVLEWLKGYGKGYQTRVNLLLRHAMANSTGGIVSVKADPSHEWQADVDARPGGRRSPVEALGRATPVGDFF